MKLSLIVPTRNRAQRVRDLLASLLTLESVSFGWECLIIDNGSTDNTHEIVERFIDEHATLHVRYIHEPKPGLHEGRHRGAKEAKGDILAYLDDDVILLPTWIRSCEAIMRDETDIIAGRSIPKWESSPPDWILSLFHAGVCPQLSMLDMGEKLQAVEYNFVFGCNFMVKRQLIFELGGFHPDGVPSDRIRFRGDGETGFAAKAAKRDARIHYVPQATVYHVVDRDRMTLEYMKKRQYAQGISQSFTDIRVRYGVSESFISPRKSLITRLAAIPPKQIAAKAYDRFRRDVLRRPHPFQAMYDEMAQSFQDGYAFHQREVANDQALLEYVLKTTYLDE